MFKSLRGVNLNYDTARGTFVMRGYGRLTRRMMEATWMDFLAEAPLTRQVVDQGHATVDFSPFDDPAVRRWPHAASSARPPFSRAAARA